MTNTSLLSLFAERGMRKIAVEPAGAVMVGRIEAQLHAPYSLARASPAQPRQAIVSIRGVRRGQLRPA